MYLKFQDQKGGSDKKSRREVFSRLNPTVKSLGKENLSETNAVVCMWPNIDHLIYLTLSDKLINNNVYLYTCCGNELMNKYRKFVLYMLNRDSEITYMLNSWDHLTGVLCCGCWGSIFSWDHLTGVLCCGCWGLSLEYYWNIASFSYCETCNIVICYISIDEPVVPNRRFFFWRHFSMSYQKGNISQKKSSTSTSGR